MGSNVAVIGTGYVGLTTGVCFAHMGHDVVCADIDSSKVERLSRGELPHHEPGLQPLLDEGLRTGRLRFVVGGINAVPDAEFIYLCVPTPMDIDGSPDLSALRSALEEIGPHVPSESVVVNKSTVPVGASRLAEQHLGRSDVAVVSNPEFLREGQAVHDFLHPDRVVIGADDKAAAIRVAGLFSEAAAPVVVTDPASAETIKYVSNAFLATKLSFVNAVAAVCESVGADADDVLLGMGYDHRVGREFLKPGPGWGGSCFPKDVRALLHLAEESGYSFDLLRSVLEANEAQFGRMADKVIKLAGKPADQAVVAAWGLTFKADTDDLRDSPSLEVLARLTAQGARVVAYDPVIADDIGLPTGVEVVDDPYAACDGADVLVVLTEWDEFRHLDLGKVAASLSSPRVVDTRNVLERTQLTRHGFVADGVGRR